MQLAVTTVALAVPVFLIRKQRAKALLNTLPPRRSGDSSSLASRFSPAPSTSILAQASQWPPPRRRSGGTSSSQFNPRPILPAASSRPTQSADLIEGAQVEQNGAGFNTPLYGAGAFGLATLIVTAVASTAVWGVKSGMSVNDVRSLVLSPTDRV